MGTGLRGVERGDARKDGVDGGRWRDDEDGGRRMEVGTDVEGRFRLM